MITRASIVFAFLFFVLNARFALGAGAIANMLEKSVFLAAVVLILAFRQNNKIILGLLAANVVLILFLGMGTTYPDFHWSTVLLGLNQIIIIYVMLAFTPEKKDCNVFLVTMALLPIISSLIGIGYAVIGIHQLFAQEFNSGVMRFEGSLIPAYLSGLAMCGILASLMLAVAGRRAIFWLVLVADLMILLMTGGRATLVVSLFVSAVALLFSEGIAPQRRIWTLGAALAVTPVLAVIFGGKIVERFMASGDNGRAIMWAYIDQLRAKYPGTGIGFAHQIDSIPRSVYIRTGSSAAHNDFLRIQLELGNLGMPLMYLLLTIAVVVSAYRRGRLDVTMLAAYGGFLFLSKTDNALAGPAYFPLFIVAAMTMYYYDPTAFAADQQQGRARRFWRMPNGGNPRFQTGVSSR